jgi:putative ABC transport system ATP-binding protein
MKSWRPEMGDFPIRCCHLSYTYYRWGQRVVAVNDLSIEIQAGEWVMLVGPNGSGKSTLLRLLAKRLPGYAGTISFGDRDIMEMSKGELADHVFYVHQNPLLGTAPDLTVFENLAIADTRTGGGFVGRRHRLEDRYGELLDPFGLSDRLRQPARNLSGGERQLLAVVVACLRPASTVLLDEPTAALDPENAARCMAAIGGLQKSGKTLLQVTHDLGLTAAWGDRMISLQAGKVVYNVSRGEDAGPLSPFGEGEGRRPRDGSQRASGPDD